MRVVVDAQSLVTKLWLVAIWAGGERRYASLASAAELRAAPSYSFFANKNAVEAPTKT